MALSLSPCPYDDDEDLAVFESTAAELGGPARPRLPELSVISPGLDQPAVMDANRKPVMSTQRSRDEGSTDRVKVFLRIRPLTEAERGQGEEQGCVAVQDEETLLLKAPKESQNMRSAERGITQNMHKFSFSKIFGPETTQQQFYENTMKKMVSDVLQGENRLIYTYGVTNSGKTYTVQGSGREAGLLPRALVSLFRKLQGRLYGAMDLKPIMYQDVRQLSAGEVRVEEIRRNSLLKEDENSHRGRSTTVWDSGIGGLSSTSNIAMQLEETDSVCLEPDSLSHSGGDDLEDGVHFSIWVSFYEIYNEFLYDLLDASPSLLPRKRATLRLSDDKQGNPYVKDLTWIQVHSAEEAWRILRAGRRNQSFASTHLNQNSSRSHSIFSIRVLHVHLQADPAPPATHISELTVCDLAGSERCKEQRNGERMKEANNINTSLLTLGRCIAALRHNQNNKSRPPQVVPFRDSKLTRVLQGFFCGRGTSSMVVNINPCASIYDETLQALKFSAIATQLVHGPSTKTRVAYILSLLREPTGSGNNSSLMEDDEDESDTEDGDITMLNTEALLQAIDVLKREVHRQREEKEVLEANVREEVVSEMMEVITGMQDGFSETLEAEQALLEERYEDKISNIQKHLKKFYSQELKERDQEIEALSAALEKRKEAEPVSVPHGDADGPRRSQRLTAHTELSRLRAELDQCQGELLAKTQELTKLKIQLEVPGSTGTLTNTADRKLEEGQRNLRQLRLDLQRLGSDLQSGERACCRNTGGERLRQALTAADETLAKQDQILVELQNGLTLVKADLRRKAETLSQVQTQLSPSGSGAITTPGSCKRRGCGAAAPSDTENRPPQKRPFFQSLFPTRTYNTRTMEEANAMPYSRILRSRQQSPPRSPAPTPRSARGKY
ncbi:kinesin-like protein KIF20A [Larimichthys crocea]|uniref:kinesin-like protein KIF20A n=1 Tax=Larimichthys crocea TaxID=215358 RepID=UPI000F5E6F04|nr:kinesin-like protein KIF20A [Larimichthys crocea]XP_027129308.1 kinesin-like protein KIF20A [Larimichthys crocea]